MDQPFDTGRFLKYPAPRHSIVPIEFNTCGHGAIKISSVFQWPGHILKIKPSAGIDSLSANDRKLWSTGRQYFLNYCSGCHGTNGQGSHMGPTLVQSEWVLGDKRRLALILLHGIEGAIEVNKKVYDKPEILPVMPSHSTLADEDISAILTYIRNEWGNAAGAMDRRTVGMTRILAQGRVQPWTAQDLNKYIETSSDISKSFDDSLFFGLRGLERMMNRLHTFIKF